MKRGLSVSLLFILVSICSVHAETVMNGLTPYGAVQSGPSCWAASLAGELEATGWAMNPNPQTIYADIVAHLGNQPYNIWPAATWYFAEYYPDVKQSDVLRSGWGISSIVQDIDYGWGVSVETFPSSGVGHGLQVYGYQEENNVVEGFFYVNSYGDESLQYLGINTNGSWFYSSGYVGSIVGIVPEDMYTPSPDPPPYIPPPDCPVPPSVPEPGIMLLLALGLALTILLTNQEIGCIYEV